MAANEGSYSSSMARKEDDRLLRPQGKSVLQSGRMRTMKKEGEGEYRSQTRGMGGPNTGAYEWWNTQKKKGPATSETLKRKETVKTYNRLRADGSLEELKLRRNTFKFTHGKNEDVSIERQGSVVHYNTTKNHKLMRGPRGEQSIINAGMPEEKQSILTAKTPSTSVTKQRKRLEKGLKL